MESKSNHRYQKIERSDRENLGFAKIPVANRYKILILVSNITINPLYLIFYFVIILIAFIKGSTVYQTSGLINWETMTRMITSSLIYQKRIISQPIFVVPIHFVELVFLFQFC